MSNRIAVRKALVVMREASPGVTAGEVVCFKCPKGTAEYETWPRSELLGEAWLRAQGAQSLSEWSDGDAPEASANANKPNLDGGN